MSTVYKPSCEPKSLDWDYLPCKLDVSSLITLRTSTPLRDANGLLQTIELGDRSSACQFAIHLAVCAIIPLENGTVEVYGGAGTDEHYATWCIIVPSTTDNTPENLIDVDVWTVPGIQKISFEIQS